MTAMATQKTAKLLHNDGVLGLIERQYEKAKEVPSHCPRFVHGVVIGSGGVLWPLRGALQPVQEELSCNAFATGKQQRDCLIGSARYHCAARPIFPSKSVQIRLEWQ